MNREKKERPFSIFLDFTFVCCCFLLAKSLELESIRSLPACSSGIHVCIPLTGKLNTLSPYSWTIPRLMLPLVFETKERWPSLVEITRKAIHRRCRPHIRITKHSLIERAVKATHRRCRPHIRIKKPSLEGRTRKFVHHGCRHRIAKHSLVERARIHLGLDFDDLFFVRECGVYVPPYTVFHVVVSSHKHSRVKTSTRLIIRIPIFPFLFFVGERGVFVLPWITSLRVAARAFTKLSCKREEVNKQKMK